MDICVYVHVNKIIRCECNNGGGGGVRVKLDKLGGAHVLKVVLLVKVVVLPVLFPMFLISSLCFGLPVCLVLFWILFAPALH